MKKVFAILALCLLLFRPLQAQKDSGQIAVDSAVDRKLTTMWIQYSHDQSIDKIVCAKSHYEAPDLIIDSIVKIVPTAPDSVLCKGVSNTIIGFVTDGPNPTAYMELIFLKLGSVLNIRPDIVAIGFIHGVQPVITGPGVRSLLPLGWMVWRTAPAAADTLHRT